jgi:hypothetical protein
MDTTHPTALLGLPNELLHHICAQLPLASCTNFRLVCSSFRDIGKQRLVSELSFFRHPCSIAKVIEISESPEWAKQVQALVYEHTDLTTWDHVYHKYTLYRSHGCERIRRAFLRHDKEQRQFRDLNLEDLLRDALTRFTNLKRIEFHLGFKEMRGAYELHKTKTIAHIGSFGSLYSAGSEEMAKQWVWEDRASMRVFEYPHLSPSLDLMRKSSYDVQTFFGMLRRLGLLGSTGHGH